MKTDEECRKEIEEELIKLENFERSMDSSTVQTQFKEEKKTSGTLLFIYSALARFIPKKLVAMCIIHHVGYRNPERISCLLLFGELNELVSKEFMEEQEGNE